MSIKKLIKHQDELKRTNRVIEKFNKEFQEKFKQAKDKRRAE